MTTNNITNSLTLTTLTTLTMKNNTANGANGANGANDGNSQEIKCDTMYVIKRTGEREEVSFDKCIKRIQKLSKDLKINPVEVAQLIITQIYDGVETMKLDELAAEICAAKMTIHPDYGRLSSRIIISNHHKNTSPSYSEVIQQLWNNKNVHGEHSPIINETLHKFVMDNKEKINATINYDNDYNYDYFGFKTLERAYLMRVNGKIVERPQHMLMRVALSIHRDDLKEALKAYKMMSEGYFTHATPTLFNMGTQREQASSCFLLTIDDDSIDGIFKTIADCGKISKHAGGIGLAIHKIRAKGTPINGTNGTSNGIVPMLKVFNETARYVDQCFTPDTMIYTIDGVKRISDVGIGDQVLGSDGAFHEVNLPVRHEYDGDMLKINSVSITPQHQVFAQKRNTEAAQFYDAEELQIGDKLVYPISKYIKDLDQYNDDDMKLYGLILSIGQCYYNNIKLSIPFEETIKITSEFVISYFAEKCIKLEIEDDLNGCNKMFKIIKWSIGNPGFKFTQSECRAFNSKFNHLPIEKLAKILEGIMMSGNRAFISNPPAILNYLFLRCGQTKPDFKTLNLHQLDFSKLDQYIYQPITSISQISYKGIVHDFEIAGPHDYTVSGLGIAHNGGGKRSGSFACYMEPWHADIEDFLRLRLNTGIEEERARDLFYALWVSDLFMRRVEEDADWTLMCPHKCPDLYLKYGKEFEELYTRYEREGRGNKIVKARYIWELYLQAQIETGMPYLGFKDSINEKNNQKNLGTIQSSNLCHEICEFTSKEEIAVCNLASIALPKFIEANKDGILEFNYEKLRDVVKQVVKNLNKVIDYNYYPVPEAEYSNRKNRPEGVGIQGLSCCFAMLKIAFDSEEAKKINRLIFENMYFAAMESSMEIARKRKKYVQEYKRLVKLGSSGNGTGELTEEDKRRMEELRKTYFIIDEELKLPNQYAGAYASYIGSPISEGKFQFDMWGVQPSEHMREMWENLRADIMKHGVRNSLLIALMPTASTSQILSHNECFEPFTNNIYTRKTLAGTFVVVNKFLIKDLLELGLWNQAMKDKIILADGSVQGIEEIPPEIRERYKTVWEIKQKAIIDLAIGRSGFVCQTQSMNLFIKNPTFKTLNSMHFYSWKNGLKTGVYYLRSQAKTQAQKFSVDLEKAKNEKQSKAEPQIQPPLPPVKEEPECLMCSS